MAKSKTDSPKSKAQETKRRDLLATLDRKVRETSAYSSLLSSVVAQRLGITINDIECLDILHLNGPMSAGKLAETTGLTTGAITGIVDRLVKAGFARRDADPADRRRVIVRVDALVGKRVAPLYESLARKSLALLSGYSDKELAFLIDHFIRSSEQLRGEVERLREPMGTGSKKNRA